MEKRLIENPSKRIYVNEIENIESAYIQSQHKNKDRILSRTFNTRKNELIGRTKNKRTKDENSENVPDSEITEAVFIHCNIVNNDYQQDSRVLYILVPNKCSGNLLDI